MNKVTIKIKRPAGNVEIVDVTKQFGSMTPAIFAKIKEGTRNAGRGEVLSYEETYVDNRSQAQKDWDAIMDAQTRVDNSVRAHNPESAAIARRECDKLIKDFAAKFPGEYQAKHVSKINRTEGYKLALAGKD
jgi:hypothetical protein